MQTEPTGIWFLTAESLTGVTEFGDPGFGLLGVLPREEDDAGDLLQVLAGGGCGLWLDLDQLEGWRR